MQSSKGYIIDLPKIVDPRGNLTVAEGLKDVPFEVKRVYWTYDVPSGESRGGHAHRCCEEFIVAVSGSFDVTLDDGRERRTPTKVCMWGRAFGAHSTTSPREPYVWCSPPKGVRRKTTYANTTTTRNI